MENAKPPQQQENALLNIGLNVLIPTLIMSKGPKMEQIQQLAESIQVKPGVTAMMIALLFPVGYGIYDFITRKKYNFFSILGFCSVLLTGLMTLFEVPKEWIAWKEAAIPSLLGIAVLASLATKKPLVRLFIFNDQVMQTHKVESILKERNNTSAFDKLLVNCTYLLAFSFFLSAFLNFVLAKVFIQSETGTEAFTQEMGKMTFWSYIIILVPSMAIMIFILYRLIQGIHSLTGLKMEEFIGHPELEKSKGAK
jgi:intracellular septation protein A